MVFPTKEDACPTQISDLAVDPISLGGEGRVGSVTANFTMRSFEGEGCDKQTGNMPYKLTFDLVPFDAATLLGAERMSQVVLPE